MRTSTIARNSNHNYRVLKIQNTMQHSSAKLIVLWYHKVNKIDRISKVQQSKQLIEAFLVSFSVVSVQREFELSD